MITTAGCVSVPTQTLPARKGKRFEALRNRRKVCELLPYSAIILVMLACGAAVSSGEERIPNESGALPVLVFQTDGKAIQDRTRVPASLTVLLPEKGGSQFSIDETASGPAELSGRPAH